MSGSIYAATSAAEVQRVRMGLLSNNLANINTTGFKIDKVAFRTEGDGAAPGETVDGDALDAGERMKLAVIPMTMRTDFSQGPLQSTGNPLDLAIQGDGFFSIQTARGMRYTRGGSFTLDAEGRLTTHEGDPVMGEGGEIAIEGAEIEVDGDGNILIDGQIADKLRIVEIADKEALKKEGANLFVLDEKKGVAEPVEYAGIHQGFLERSNAHAVKIMTDLIEVMRGYESYQKIIRTLDEINSKLIAGVGNPY
jgi:flagellar basal-body rod protein FlgG